MVVDDVEVPGALVTGECVVQLGDRPADQVADRVLVGEVELRLRVGVAGGEEGDFVAGVDEAVGEQGNDPFDAAVTLGRNGEPHRRYDRDPHWSSSTCTVPSSTRTSHCRSYARTPVSRIRPTHEGSSGATVSSTWRSWSGRSPRSVCNRSTSVPAAQACGRAAVG